MDVVYAVRSEDPQNTVVVAPPIAPLSIGHPPYDPNNSASVSYHQFWSTYGEFLSTRLSTSSQDLQALPGVLIQVFVSGYHSNLCRTFDSEAHLNQLGGNKLLRVPLSCAPLQLPKMPRWRIYFHVLKFMYPATPVELCNWMQDYLVNPNEPRYEQIIAKIQHAGEVTNSDLVAIARLIINGAVEGHENLVREHVWCRVVMLLRSQQVGLDWLNNALAPPLEISSDPCFVGTLSHTFGVRAAPKSKPTEERLESMWKKEKKDLKKRESTLRPHDPRVAWSNGHQPIFGRSADFVVSDAANTLPPGHRHITSYEMLCVYFRQMTSMLSERGLLGMNTDWTIVGLCGPEDEAKADAEMVRRSLEVDLVCAIQYPGTAWDDLAFCCIVLANIDSIPKGETRHGVFNTADGNKDADDPMQIRQSIRMWLEHGHDATILASDLSRVSNYYRQLSEQFPGQVSLLLLSRS